MLPNISRSKGNQTIKFYPLMEYNVRNIFLEKPFTKCAGKVGRIPFHKKGILSICLDQQSEMLQV